MALERFSPKSAEMAAGLQLPTKKVSLPSSLLPASVTPAEVKASSRKREPLIPLPPTPEPSPQPEEKLADWQRIGRDLQAQHLTAFAQTQDPKYLHDFQSLVRNTSQHNGDGELQFFLHCVLNWSPFENIEKRILFLNQVLPVIFQNVSKMQLATLFLQEGSQLPLYLLQSQANPSVAFYWSLMQRLLQDGLINHRLYENIIFSPQVIQTLIEQKEPDANLTRIYLNVLSPILQAGLVQWRLSDYLRLLSCADLEIQAYEAQLIEAMLTELEYDYSTRQVTREACFAELSKADSEGRSPLQLFLSTGNSRLAGHYLNCLSWAADSDGWEALARSVDAGQETILHGLANSGSLKVLSLFIAYLIEKLGREKASVLLKDLAESRNSERQQPSCPVFTHPLNQALTLLRQGKVMEATKCLKVAQNASYSAFYSATHSMLFFTGSPQLSYERTASQEMLFGRHYLTNDLVEALDKPPERKF